MAKLQENLLSPKPWSDLIMGNHALARAMIEAGVRVATTFPGSPTPEIAAALDSISKEKRPYYFEYSTNEKVALEVATGASLNGHLSTVFFKSVGLNVASDSLIQLSLMELIGGMVVILGDDPGANSSQNEQDNRYFARMSYIPMLEPDTPSEAYEMFLEAVRLSKKYKAPVFVRLTTHVCHAKEVVEFQAANMETPDWTSRFDPKNGPYLPLVKWVFPLKKRALEKLASFEEEAEQSPFNSVLEPNGGGQAGGKRLGIISTALPALSVLENLHDSRQEIQVLKLGMSYPLPRKKIVEFLDEHDEIVIIEELDRVMETEIKSMAWDADVRCRIMTRTAAEQLTGELTPDRTWALLGEHWPELFESRDSDAVETEVAPRIAQMCPGCGHRSAYQGIRAALENDTITVGDIGCHSLGFFPPYNVGQVLLCMGHSTGTGAGLAIGNERKVVTFLGDATLFHAGWPGIINAVVNNHDITLVVMENGTTAMTGHQPRPGTGEIGDKIPIRGVFEALGVGFIREVDTYNQARLAEYVRESMGFKGFSVVIAKHPCMLKFVRTQRSKVPDFKISHVEIDQEKCDQSRECIQSFGCPSFVSIEDGTVSVHPDLCIGDGSCLKTCPANAIVRNQKGGRP
ncbi:MAG: indolepyruvate ferredoxin oxidoreductase [Deltaproteobacteria bacterium]|nr:indolepyruvate ferredoxin oxidoreductase [Deltaproteobacteria bacterium]